MSDKRRCIGSTTFGIEAHDAPISDFPVQASQKDGLGRMCKPHWTEYTRALRQASLASKAAPTVEAPAAEGTVMSFAAGISRQTRKPRNAPEPIRTLPARNRRGAQFPAAGSRGDAT